MRAWRVESDCRVIKARSLNTPSLRPPGHPDAGQGHPSACLVNKEMFCDLHIKTQKKRGQETLLLYC